jgi:hypothetical protein
MFFTTTEFRFKALWLKLQLQKRWTIYKRLFLMTGRGREMSK